MLSILSNDWSWAQCHALIIIAYVFWYLTLRHRHSKITHIFICTLQTSIGRSLHWQRCPVYSIWICSSWRHYWSHHTVISLRRLAHRQLPGAVAHSAGASVSHHGIHILNVIKRIMLLWMYNLMVTSLRDLLYIYIYMYSQTLWGSKSTTAYGSTYNEPKQVMNHDVRNSW